jgi:hypothetical protein
MIWPIIDTIKKQLKSQINNKIFSHLQVWPGYTTEQNSFDRICLKQSKPRRVGVSKNILSILDHLAVQCD